MNFVQLFINDPANATLDLDQELDIALQYSIADIKDITKRNAAYSKTITLPGTKNNNFWFGNLFDINSDFTMFNPNKKVSSRLMVNTETVMDGFIQLRKIKKLVNVDNQGNMIQYEVVMYNNAIDLMSELGEKSLGDLNMGKYGHTFSNVSVKDSWDNTYNDGYVYPMYGTDTKDNKYRVENFYPAPFYRTVLDTILQESGFGWTGSLKTNAQFNKEILAYTGDGKPKIPSDEIERRLFKIGLTNSTMNYSLGSYFNNFISSNIWDAFPSNVTTTPSFSNSASASNYFDNGNTWNETLYRWDVDRNGSFAVNYNFSFNLNLRNPHPTTTMQVVTDANGNSNFPEIRADFKVQVSKNNGSTWTDWSSDSLSKTFNQAIIGPGASASRYYGIAITTAPKLLNINDKVRLVINYKQTKIGAGWAGTGGNATPAMTGFMVYRTDGAGNYIQNRCFTTEVSQGDYVDLSNFLSDKVKQKDLISDLIKRYNLFIQTDENNPRLLFFDTRPDFYSRGVTLDWTNKKDYSSEDQIELLSELQFKQMLFTYKADTDTVNKAYTDNIGGDIYGQYRYSFDNDFVKGENKVESVFSPTPIIKTIWNAYLPAINPDNPKGNQRVLYWGGLKSYGNGWQWTYQDLVTGATTSAESFTTYPYAGHFDDPVTPTLDINFGACKFYFYGDYQSIPQANMYNTYWSNYVDQIEDGRLVTSKFYLDEYDIRFVKDNFNAKIFILDSYYYVNKIIDYKPLNNSVTTVELIKINEGVKYNPKRGLTSSIATKPNLSVSRVDGMFVINGSNNTGNGGVVVGSGNVVGGSTTTKDGVTKVKSQVVSGDDNSVSGNNTIVSGDRNVLEGDDSSILGGSDNIVTADKVVIMSGNGNIVSESNITLIGVNNMTATQSGMVYLGPSFSIANDGSMYFNGVTFSGGSGTSGSAGTSGTSGFDGTSGTSGTSGAAGVNGTSGTSGSSGAAGVNGTSGTSASLSISGTTNYITKFTSSTTIGTSSVIDNGTQVIFTNDGSATSPTIGFSSANDTGLFFAYQHPFNNRLAITANGATAAIFTSASTIISSLATTPGTPNRMVQVLPNGALTVSDNINVITGVHNPVMATGSSYNQQINALSKSQGSVTANRIELAPYIPAVTHTVTSLSMEVVILSAGNARIIVYSDLDSYPDTRLFESTNLNTGATGMKTYNISYTFNQGIRYWVGVYFSATPTCRQLPPGSLIPISIPSAAGGTFPNTVYRVSVAGLGSSPDPFGTAGVTTTLSAIVEVKFAI